MFPSLRLRTNSLTILTFLVAVSFDTSDAFITPQASAHARFSLDAHPSNAHAEETLKDVSNVLSKMANTAILTGALIFSQLGGAGVAHAENELADIYGGKGFDSSLVDQTCLVDKCSLQAKACLADDPSCRKGLTCTAKCLGDNTCITGCMARYGDSNLDNLLKCTIEDNDCIKIAILPGGADKLGEEPLPPAPTVRNFDLNSMEGSWYKVAGYNPNYDCYACQRNTFSQPDPNAIFGNPFNDKLQVDVEFSMPRMLPDGSPPPPSNVRESVSAGDDGSMFGSQSIGFNDYATHEMMVFDSKKNPAANFIKMGKDEKSFARTAHSEGEMFGLKFWENWYVIGENNPGEEEFKFVYYNGKTRQNNYEGAFVYSRTKNLDAQGMKKVYRIASDAGLNPDQFCKIQNGCFKDAPPGAKPDAFRSFVASTKVSQLLGVEPVAAEGGLLKRGPVSAATADDSERPWWNLVGDYLENPHRHFQFMDDHRINMDWPEEVRNQVRE